MAQIDEARLIERAKEGDITAFNRLVLHHQDAVYNYAYTILYDSDAAADAAQDAFISAYKAINRFRTGNFRSWLYRIVKNKCLDALRKKKRHPEPSIDEMTEENESASFLSDMNELPEDEAQRAELVNAIQHCLNGLSDDQRMTVALCDVEGFDYAEIAESLNISLGTVKSRINRGRRKLQNCLRDFMELLPERYR